MLLVRLFGVVLRWAVHRFGILDPGHPKFDCVREAPARVDLLALFAIACAANVLLSAAGAGESSRDGSTKATHSTSKNR